MQSKKYLKYFFKNCNQFILVTVFLILTIFSFKSIEENFERISLNMQSKKVLNGKLIITNADVFYNAEGKMVTHILAPFETIIINNIKGDLSIYNPKQNQVYKDYNFTQGTETSSLYYFLKDKNNELGLRTLGFRLNTSKFENGFLITTWFPPANYIKLFSSVELVYQNGKPIFLKFVNNKNFVIKRSYYYNYTKILNYNFPLAITHIEYGENGDSTIEKTVYSNIKVNNQATNSYFDYNIPANAKIIKKN
jgi:outer membrane lipoprotein-sorting protein